MTARAAQMEALLPLLRDAAPEMASRMDVSLEREVTLDPKGDFKYHLLRDPGKIILGKQAFDGRPAGQVLEEAIRQAARMDAPDLEPRDHGVELRITVRALDEDDALAKVRDCLREALIHNPEMVYWDFESYGLL